MMARVKIAAVSYLNTVPFIYGLERSEIRQDALLLLSPPSGCADAMANGSADIALIPVAEIPHIEGINIVGNHCLGSDGNVRTVTLMSLSPLEKIERIYLDTHSRTSVLLIRILAREHWGITPEWIPLDDHNTIVPREGTGYLLIGDKVFGYENMFPYRYDLAQAWKDMTGLPFVFAAWVARGGTPQYIIERLEKALDYGIEHIREAAQTSDVAGVEESVKYLTENINFVLDTQKRKAMQLFWEKMREYALKINPG